MAVFFADGVHHSTLRALAGRAALVASITIVLAGCREAARPKRYSLQGEVTWQGRPVPAGSMIITPNAAAGNVGPAAGVDIRDGRYRTLPGRGTIGGPHVVQIHGYDGQVIQTPEIFDTLGKQLFPPVRLEIDLPASDATHDFRLPAP
jgi:hypothetical protein